MTTITTFPTNITTNHGDGLTLVVHQIRYEQKAFWRNRPRAFFSVALPLLFLVVFNALNGSHHIEELGGISYATWFVPGILAYGLIMATFTNLATSVTASRDSGVLKRVRGTALPVWVFVTGKIISTLATAVVLVAATLALGIGLYGVRLPTHSLPGFVVTAAAGTICFTALGLAATTVIPNAESAPALTNVFILPLSFISGIWMVLDNPPRWLELTADAFPLHALAHGLQHAVNPATAGSGFVAGDLVTLALWTVFGIVVSLRWFRWERA